MVLFNNNGMILSLIISKAANTQNVLKLWKKKQWEIFFRRGSYDFNEILWFEWGFQVEVVCELIIKKGGDYKSMMK